MQRHTSKTADKALSNRGWTLAMVLAVTTQLVPAAAHARPAGIVPAADPGDEGNDGDALPYLQCVPFARQASGIDLRGDAHTWWDQADGRYARGRIPAVGAVMSFRPHGAMSLGHVAMVSRIIDDRTVLLRHANWSLINGRRGNVELDVRAVDVSSANDWSEVRVWYAPIGDLGTTRWPVNGFIYKHAPRKGDEQLVPRSPVLASADSPRVTRLSYRSPAQTPAKTTAQTRVSANFLDGIATDPATTQVRPTRNWLVARAPLRSATAHSTELSSTAPALRDDPIGRIIAAHMPAGGE